MAPPKHTSDYSVATHLSTPKGWKAKLAQLVDLQRTVYPRKWSPVSCRSSAGQGKLAGEIPTFYHCATQLLASVWSVYSCVCDVQRLKPDLHRNSAPTTSSHATMERVLNCDIIVTVNTTVPTAPTSSTAVSQSANSTFTVTVSVIACWTLNRT